MCIKNAPPLQDGTFLFYTLRLRAASDLRFLLTLGFSYLSRFLTSDKIPAFWIFFLNLLKALSILSFSPTLTSAIYIFTTFIATMCNTIYDITSKIVFQVGGGKCIRLVSETTSRVHCGGTGIQPETI